MRSTALWTIVFIAGPLTQGVLAQDTGRLPGGTVPFAKALAKAEKSQTGLTLLFSRFEKGTRWGFYFLDPFGRVVEKEISMTGDLLVDKEVPEIKDKGKVDPKVVAALKERSRVKLPNGQYAKIALDKFGGDVMGFELILNDGQLQVQINGASDSGRWEATLDMSTGKLLSSK